MKKLLSLIILFFFTINVLVLSAETKDDSVTDFFNQDQTDSIEPGSEDQILDQEDGGEDQPPLLNNQTPNLFGLIVKVVLVLALIIGLIYILLKIFNQTSRFNKQGESLINLGGLSLGSNKSVQMIKVGEQVYLIGVGDNVSILTEITDEDFKQQVLEKREAPSLPINALVNQFNIKKRTNKPNHQQAEIDVNDNFAALFKGELDTMKEKRKEIRAKFKEEE
ncbi:flagellar biosynthetic protein FliO [Amphibacillus sp. MSJ-3]|uniref:flagellar biosynthetic protein FliO n=1 Tax=Amphibacillus sp. MSJ-3 TaxID=2841505 RepID=UPI001C0F2E40|nr:flagellar biosynthetic protein FliO [Amphibacillus sp. MSJ-3]MBU5594970.1 flagellar biosynthetic protein FliO [Amphibacillus sp. MSJ-3]